jgi:Tfp pilus assembly protein PilV
VKICQKRKRALTLFEAMLAASILAVVAVVASQAIVAGQMQTYDALHRQRALTLADSLIDEILRLPYDDPDGASTPGPESGETTRAAFDNIDDYHGFTEAGSLTITAGTLMDATGTAYSDPYQFFTQSVTVATSTQNVTALGGNIAGVLVTVTIADDNGQSWSLESFVPQPPTS